MRSTSAFCAILFGLLACTATKTNAQIVEYAYEAVVTEVEEEVGSSFAAVQLGDTITGSLRYDLGLPDFDPFMSIGQYRPAGSEKLLSGKIDLQGGQSIVMSADPSQQGSVIVADNISGPPLIGPNYDVISAAQGVLIEGGGGATLVLDLLSSLGQHGTDGPFTSDELPEELMLEDFQSPPGTPEFLASGATVFVRRSFSADIVSLTRVVPEPHGASLLVVALLGAQRWRLQHARSTA